MIAAEKLDDPRAEAAIGWMVELSSDEASAGAQTEFETWLRADPANERAWVHLMESLMPYSVAARQRLPRGTLTNGLLQKHRSRRAFLTGLVATCGVGTLGLAVTDRFLPVRNILADHFTLTAQQRHVMLADGSDLLLAPRTAINLQQQPSLRSVQLLDGAVMARVKERTPPFQILVDDVALKTGEGAFLVEWRDDVLTLSGIEGSAAVEQGGANRYNLDPGNQLVFADGRVQRTTIDVGMATAWVDGLLVARDRPLSSIVAEIRPYFSGVIRLDPAAAALRVTGVFSLKKPNEALDAVAEVPGLSVERIAGYWVNIRAQQI